MSDNNDKRLDGRSNDGPSISAAPASPTNARPTVETPVKVHERQNFDGHNTSNAPMSASALVDMIITPQKAPPSVNNNIPSNNTRHRKAEADGDTEARGTASDEVIFPAEAAVLAEIVALRDRDSELLSDFSILRGEFRKAEYESDPNHKFTREFRERGLDSMVEQFTIYEELRKLEKYLKRFRQQRAANELTAKQKTEEGSEVEVLKVQKKAFEEKKKKITDLRIALENLGKAKHAKYYSYPLDVRYQIIGNQVIPDSAKAKRRRSTNGVKLGNNTAGKRDTPGDDSSDELDATPSRSAKKGKKNDGTAARKTKPPPTLSSLFPHILTSSSPKTSVSTTYAHGSHSTPATASASTSASASASASHNREAPVVSRGRGRGSRAQQALSQVEDANKVNASNEMAAILETQEVERNLVLIEKSNAEVFRKQAEENKKAADEEAARLELLRKEIEELKRAKEALQ